VVLSRWSGWGALPEVFDTRQPRWAAETRARLGELLTAEEVRAANRTILNAHYTPPGIAQALWGLVEAAGWERGRVLEPGCGVGVFAATAPLTAGVFGVELDPITSRISGLLHPAHTVVNQSLADLNVGEVGQFTAAVGNVPFGDVRPLDPVINPDRNLALHNYAIAKALQLAMPGVPVVIITSAFTLDARDPAARLVLAGYGDLVGAMRLPEVAFWDQAGTKATTDVLVFRRRPEVLSGDQVRQATDGQAWMTTHSLPVIDDRTGQPTEVTVNGLYADPDGPNVVGRITNGGMYARDTSRTVIDPADYPTALTTGLAHLTTTVRAATRPPVDQIPIPPTLATPSPSPAMLPPVEPSTVPPPRSRSATGAVERSEPPPGWVKPGGLFGRRSTGFWQLTASGPVRYEARPKKDARVLDAYLRLRDVYLQLVEAEQNPAAAGGEDLDGLRAGLNEAYDRAVGLLGHPLSHVTYSTTKDGERRPRYPPVGGARRWDPDFHAVLALEHYDPLIGHAEKAAIFTTRQIRPPEPVEWCATAAEAVAVSLAESGRIDPGRVAGLLGVDRENVAGHLFGAAFLDHAPRTSPDRAGSGEEVWVPAGSYLSGNVRAKLAAATALAATDRRYQPNVTALAEVVPADLEPEEISVQLGAPWLTAEEVSQFLRDTLEASLTGMEVLFHPAIGWRMAFPKHLERGVAMTEIYGTPSMSALRIAACALQGRPIRVMVTDPVTDRPVLDRDATIEALAKLDELNSALSEWVTSDPERASILAERYNRLFRSQTPPSHGPSWPRPPGLAAHLTLRDHQTTAVARALLDGSLGLYHAVGAGKTITMASIAVELRRLGLARCTLMVVPNHLVDQIAADVRRAYPAARVLVPSDRSVKGRAQLVSSVVAGDWDAVVFSHELFKAIPVEPATEIAYLEQRCDELRDALTLTGTPNHRPGLPDSDLDPDGNGGGEVGSERGSTTPGEHRRTAKQIEATIARFEEQIKHLRSRTVDPTLTFEALGVDAVLVDEAHAFKNLVLPGTNSDVVNKASRRALDLDLKLGVLRRHAAAAGRRLPVVLATGTPVTNSFAELWVMMRYLQPEVLDAAEIGRFDQFLAQFGSQVTDYELRPTGTWQLKTRIARFNNVCDLQLLFAQTAHVLRSADLDLDRPALDGGARRAVTVPANPGLDGYIADLADRAASLDPRDPSADNLLKIYTDGRKAALSLQLVGLPDPTPSKLDLAADQILTTWQATRHHTYTDPRTGRPHPTPGALQIVFMDLGVPTRARTDRDEERVDLYGQLRDLLVEGGIPAEQVAFVQDAGRDKEALFDQCRNGRYAVLVGSTATMGTGMNVQARAVSLIHMDPTWTPADMEQREGRILRQGNQNPTVTICNMLAEGSTDSLMYQGLERKAAMIDQVLTNTNQARTVADIADPLIHYGDMKAIAAGDPRIVEQLAAKRQLDELATAKRAWDRRAVRLAQGTPIWQAHITDLTPRLDALRRLDTDRPDITAWPLTVSGDPVTDLADADQALRQRWTSYSYSPDQPTLIGSLGPWPVHAVNHHTTHASGHSYTCEITITATGYDVAFNLTLTERDLSPRSRARLWQRILNQPYRSLDHDLAATEDTIRRARADLDQAARYTNRPFPHQAQLDDTRAHLAHIEHQLTADQAVEEPTPTNPTPARRPPSIDR
jgi:N12 class adenine-specific DNA methylase